MYDGEQKIQTQIQQEHAEWADLSVDRSQDVLNSGTLVRSDPQEDALPSQAPPPPAEQLPAASSSCAPSIDPFFTSAAFFVFARQFHHILIIGAP